MIDNKSLDPAILMQKLHNTDNDSSEIVQAYKDSIKSDDLNELISDIKKMTDVQYDFKFLTREKEYFGINRHDTRELCDVVCKLIGNRIEDICIKPIICAPSKYEDYCPFPSNTLVVYSTKPLTDVHTVTFDGKKYSIIDSKLETTPYYSIYCGLLNI